MDTFEKNTIIKLRKIRKTRHITYQNILDKLESNGEYLSLSTVRRVFTADLETTSFRYNETIKPIADILFRMEDNYRSEYVADFVKRLKTDVDAFYEYICKEY